MAIYLFYNQITKYLCSEPYSNRHPHRVNYIASIVNNPSHSSTMWCLGNEYRFYKSKETEISAEPRIQI